MNTLCSPRLLAMFLVASMALNVWQFLRPQPPAETKVRNSIASAMARNQPRPVQLPGKAGSQASDEAEVAGGEVEDDEEMDLPIENIVGELPPEQQSEDDLIYGTGKTNFHIRRETDERVSTKRLKEMANTPPSAAERYKVRARLRLPGDRVVNLGNGEGSPGQVVRFTKSREFPFPMSYALPRVGAPSENGVPGYPVVPATPGNFEFENTGLEIELDITPASGTLVVGGNFTQTVFENFEQMPGEGFSPIQDETGVLLTDNKVLQPQFTTRESRFVAAATAGQPCQVPVLMSFGQTVLELTCTPLE